MKQVFANVRFNIVRLQSYNIMTQLPQLKKRMADSIRFCVEKE